MFISQWLYWYLGLSTAEQDLDQKDILGHSTLFMFGWNSASFRVIFFHANLSRMSSFPGQGKSRSFLGISTVEMSLPTSGRRAGGDGWRGAVLLQGTWRYLQKIFIPRAEIHHSRHCTNTRQSPGLICSQSKRSVPLWLLKTLKHIREVPSTWINTGHLC